MTCEPLLLLNKADSLCFGSLTVASLRPTLKQLINSHHLNQTNKRIGSYVAWGVRENGKNRLPLGLLLAKQKGFEEVREEALSLKVLSIAVRKSWRGKGIARSLLRSAAEWGRREGLKSLELDMPLRDSSTAALERITAPEKGWQDADGLVLVTLSNPAKVGPLLHRLKLLAERQQTQWGWSILPYPKVPTPELKEFFKNPKLPSWAIPQLTTFNDIEPIDSKYSRLLVMNNQLIGWLISHRVSSDLLRYSILWLDPQWQHSAGGLAMLADVMQEAHFSGIELQVTNQTCCQPFARGCFGFSIENRNFTQLSFRKFRPVASQWIETRSRLLKLSEG